MTISMIKREILEQACGHHSSIRHLPSMVSLSIDSRHIAPGDIFFAIRGDMSDGHDYISDAETKGASLIVAERNYQNKIRARTPVILVDNSLDIFSLVASLYLDTFNLKKIAITGSNGKTTTKEMLKALLIEIFGEQQVYASTGNKNNHFGVPLSALEVNSLHRVAIFEMGMNHPGEITRLCEIIRPNYGVITNIAYAHGGNFVDGIDGVERAKGELFHALAKNKGIAIVNSDDERVLRQALCANLNNCVSFGHNDSADIRVVSHEPFSMALQSQQISLSLKHEKTFACEVPLAGAHHAMNAASAIATVHALGLSVYKAVPGLMRMTKTDGRMNLIRSSKGYIIINDGYNANLMSMTAGILASKEIPAKRRIAAIGAMGELGDKSEEHHFELGRLLALHFDKLFMCGDESRHAAQGAKNAGMSDEQIVLKPTSNDLIEPLKKTVCEGDMIFIKGSLSANMRAIALALQNE